MNKIMEKKGVLYQRNSKSTSNLTEKVELKNRIKELKKALERVGKRVDQMENKSSKTGIRNDSGERGKRLEI